MSAGPQPTKYLSKDTNLETLLKEGHINQRMAAAVTFAFIEVYGLGEKPENNCPCRLIADVPADLAVATEFRRTFR